MPKGKTDAELWTVLEGLDDDLLDPNLPDAVVDEELNGIGIDPHGLAKKGIDFVTVRKEKKRLSWQVDAAQHRADLQARAQAKLPAAMDRSAMLVRLHELRAADPQLGAAIRMAARKRKPEESSDEELRALLGEMEALRSIEDDDTE